MRSRYIAVIFLRITHERHPVGCLQGRRMGRHLWLQMWPKFYHCNCCSVCTIASYIATIYRENIVQKTTYWHVFLRMLLTSQHWFRQWLGAMCQQAITWNKVDQYKWCLFINSLWPSDTVWLHRILACCYQRCSMAFTWEQFHKKYLWTLSVTCVKT